MKSNNEVVGLRLSGKASSLGRQKFVEIVSREVMKFDSPVLASVRIAQACLESNFGQSELALMARNFFGIKASYPWEGETYPLQSMEYRDGLWQNQTSDFRQYLSLTESCQDHARFFQSTPWRKVYYQPVIQGLTAQVQAQALSGRYASDPDYGDKLVEIIETYHLLDFDQTDKDSDGSASESPIINSRSQALGSHQIIDRRKQALGGQRRERSRERIRRIVWHYTAVARERGRFISDHENYWSKILGWDRGGYHFYIDSQGRIYQNYDLERITWGVANNNGDTVHISVEANHRDNYSVAQIAARRWLTLHLLRDLNLSASQVFGHWEVNPNTACPGYTRAEMDVYRRELAALMR